MPVTIILPWPPSELNPNQSRRMHWGARAKAATYYKHNCTLECRRQGLKGFAAERVNVTIQFLPPDRRKRDDDNIIGAFKAGRDAVASYIGVDDADWIVTYLPWGEPVKDGAVLLTLEDAE